MSDVPPILQEKSDPLPNGVVLVSGCKTGGDRKYHTNPDCRYLTNKHKEWDKDLAEAWEIPQCKLCAGEIA